MSKVDIDFNNPREVSLLTKLYSSFTSVSRKTEGRGDEETGEGEKMGNVRGESGEGRGEGKAVNMKLNYRIIIAGDIKLFRKKQKKEIRKL